MRIDDVKTDPRGIVMIIERKGLLTHSWNIQGVFILDRGYYSFGNEYRVYHNMIHVRMASHSRPIFKLEINI